MRINIIGCSCSGKTTLASRLAKELNIEHIELDNIFWSPGWKEMERNEFRETVNQVTNQHLNWSIDGNYSKVRDIIWNKTSHIIWLDYSFPLVFARCLRRTIRRAITKEYICNGNQESFKISFFSKDSIILWVLKTYKRRKREYPTMLDKIASSSTKVIRITHPNQVERVIKELKGMQTISSDIK
jgi:adenylate kinase family enzyme